MSLTVRELVTDWIDRTIKDLPHLAENREELIDKVTECLEEDNFQEVLDKRAESEGKIAMRILISEKCGHLVK